MGRLEALGNRDDGGFAASSVKRNGAEQYGKAR